MDGRRPAFARVHRTRPTGRSRLTEGPGLGKRPARAFGLHIGLHKNGERRAWVTLLLKSRSTLSGSLGAPVPVVALLAGRGDSVPGIHLAVTQ